MLAIGLNNGHVIIKEAEKLLSTDEFYSWVRPDKKDQLMCNLKQGMLAGISGMLDQTGNISRRRSSGKLQNDKSGGSNDK